MLVLTKNDSCIQLNYHPVLAMPSSPGLPDCTESSSPVNQQSDSQKVMGITQSAELITTIVDDDDENQTLLAVSDLPQLPAQRATKVDVAAVTPRVTRSNNITSRTVQKPPASKPNKKSVPRTNLPGVKRDANLKTPQITTLAPDHSVISVDVDKFPDSKEAMPPSKKRRSAAAGGTIVREVMKSLDEPQQLEDSPLEITMSPVREAIQVPHQERPTKRARIDPAKPALPYQRKKYGRNVRTSSPRAQSPAIPAVDFDEIPEPKSTGAVERPKSRVSAMKSKRVGKKTEGKPATPPKRKQEHQDVKVVVKPTAPAAPKVPVSLTNAKRDHQAREPLDCHVGQIFLFPQFYQLTSHSPVT